MCAVCLCSAGVGRTGVFITLSIVLERMRYEGAVDIFQTVKMLRTQRPAMVQTEVKNSLLYSGPLVFTWEQKKLRRRSRLHVKETANNP